MKIRKITTYYSAINEELIKSYGVAKIAKELGISRTMMCCYLSEYRVMPEKRYKKLRAIIYRYMDEINKRYYKMKNENPTV